MEESFRREIERMVGLNIENKAQNTSVHEIHGRQGFVQYGAIKSIPTRIRTTGEMEAHPLFAAALLDRARTLSKDAAKETIILVAHGSEDDQQNEPWLQILEALAMHMRMRKTGGNEFCAIRMATWREDWPDKRGPWIEKVRTMVKEAQKQGGSALVIPVRIMNEGHEKKFLAGLEYELGSGFARHPLFAQWVEEQIKADMVQLGVNK
ncbi:hypothetical protein [Nitrosomonas sp. Nm34]|uniref:hypothetical protein n=1 Tax=Nitrosomonas sp. Nm34 TaxID=1881055 RepID=UPI0008EB76BD|nr:hypothetical protein [Nitrosomonas sp. Nm34]SFI32561.1 hypothetical protein SAMN05428978_1005139 [Nitrosomonas sp. Nm34]